MRRNHPPGVATFHASVSTMFLPARAPLRQRTKIQIIPAMQRTRCLLAPFLAAATAASVAPVHAWRNTSDAVRFTVNSGDDKLSLHASLAGAGGARTWDANTAGISPLELEPWTTTVVVVGGAAPSVVAAN
jgi:hypothetical protein